MLIFNDIRVKTVLPSLFEIFTVSLLKLLVRSLALVIKNPLKI